MWSTGRGLVRIRLIRELTGKVAAAAKGDTLARWSGSNVHLPPGRSEISDFLSISGRWQSCCKRKHGMHPARLQPGYIEGTVKAVTTRAFVVFFALLIVGATPRPASADSFTLDSDSINYFTLGSNSFTAGIPIGDV